MAGFDIAALLAGILGPVIGGTVGGLGAAAGGASWNGANVNVNTDYANNPMWKQAFGSGGLFDSTSASMNALLSGSQSYDPTAWLKDYLKASPDLMNLISGPVDSVRGAMDANLANFTKNAFGNTAQSLSGMGGLYSGALGQIAGQAVGTEVANQNAQLEQLLAGLFGNMSGQAMSGFQSGRQLLPGLAMQGAQVQSGLLGQLMGMGADLSSPMYQYQPGILDYILQGAGVGAQAGSGIGSMLSALGGGKKKGA